VKLVDFGVETTRDTVRLTGRIRRDTLSDTIEIWFEYPSFCSPAVLGEADAFLPILLVASMEYGERLVVTHEVSRAIVENLDDIQDIFALWYPDEMKRIDVEIPNTVERSRLESGASAAFFSGGVDSFYTLLKSRQRAADFASPLTHLLYMKGVETFLAESQGLDHTEEVARNVADDVGKKAIVGITNLRDHFPFDWGRILCGAGLASIALSLAGTFDRILIPSSGSYLYEDLYPWSTHPLLDRLWSTERTRIVHDGAEIQRVGKVALVGRNPLALRCLRVCMTNAGGEWNCGKCPKCVRTMIALKALGMLAQAQTFPHELPETLLDLINLRDEVERAFMRENLIMAQREGKAPDLVQAIQRRLRRVEVKTALEMIFGVKVVERILRLLKGIRSGKPVADKTDSAVH
jgi:hypothetical protein